MASSGAGQSQPWQASAGSSQRTRRLVVSALLLVGIGAATVAVPSRQDVVAPKTPTPSDETTAVPHRRHLIAHTPPATFPEDADHHVSDGPLPTSDGTVAPTPPSQQMIMTTAKAPTPSTETTAVPRIAHTPAATHLEDVVGPEEEGINRPLPTSDDPTSSSSSGVAVEFPPPSERAVQAGNDTGPEAAGVRVSRRDHDINDEYHHNMTGTVTLTHSNIEEQLQPAANTSSPSPSSSVAAPPRRVRGSSSSSSTAGPDDDDDTDSDVLAPTPQVPAATHSPEPPRRTPPPLLDPHPDLPCYERFNDDQERVFWRCGVAPRSKVHKLEDDDPETLLFRRCIDPTIANPDRIAISNILDAIVAVYGDNDVVSRSAYGTGSWESLNLRIMRDALSQRREWRAHRLQELGFSADQAEAAAQSDVFLLDIGTNVGAFSLPIAHAGFRVLGFEAMPTNQALLHISQCIGNVSQHQLSVQRMGLSDRDADCQLLVPRENQGNGKLRCHGPKLSTNKEIIVRGDVPLRRLDDQMALRDTRSVVADDPRLRELTGPDAILRSTEYVMKIDVEFHEPEVFRGAVKFFDDKHLRPSIVLFELTWGLNETLDAVQMLVSHGYAMLNRWDLQWVTNEMEVDELFTRARARFRKYDQHDAVFMLPMGRVSSAAHLKATMSFERLHADLLAAMLDRMPR